MQQKHVINYVDFVHASVIQAQAKKITTFSVKTSDNNKTECFFGVVKGWTLKHLLRFAWMLAMRNIQYGITMTVWWL